MCSVRRYYNRYGLGKLVIYKSVQLIGGEEKTRRLVRNGRELVARMLSWKSDCQEKTLCVMFGVCNSVRLLNSCVKIRCQETGSGDCSTLRTLVCVCLWSVKCSHESWAYKWVIKRVTNPNPVYNHSYIWQYYNRFDQSIARQQLCKHGPAHNNRWSCVFLCRPRHAQYW
jgi:hypothetical protein